MKIREALGRVPTAENAHVWLPRGRQLTVFETSLLEGVPAFCEAWTHIQIGRDVLRILSKDVGKKTCQRYFSAQFLREFRSSASDLNPEVRLCCVFKHVYTLLSVALCCCELIGVVPNV